MARRARTSQKDRLARLRAEKAARARSSAAAAKGAAGEEPARKKTRSRAGAKTGRKVIVWAVYDSAFRVVETFPFKQQAEAEKLARKLTREKKKPFVARRLKQDM